METSAASFSGAVLILLTACTPSMLVMGMAKDDLSCSEDEIEVSGYGAYTAEGCGRRMHYICSGGPSGGGCIRNGEVETIDSEKPKPKPKKTAPSKSQSRRTISLGDVAGTLARAQAASRECLAADGPSGQTHLKITFAPSGEATQVDLEEPYDGTEVGECIRKRFMRANVPPFDGDPVVIGKTFSLERP